MFQPLHALITVVLDAKEGKTKGGLILPDNFDDVLVTGTVRAVGTGIMENGVLNVPPIYAGQRVVVAQQTQRRQNGSNQIIPFPEIEDDGVKCVLINYQDIWGTITPPPALAN